MRFRRGGGLDPDGLGSLARTVDPTRAASFEAELAPFYSELPPEVGRVALAAGALLAVCYPALVATVRREPATVARIVTDRDLGTPRSRRAYLDLARGAVGDVEDEARVRAQLRVFARRERLRIALREILPRAMHGADVDVTSRELAMLADATIEVALEEARAWARRRYGDPVGPDGAESRFVVLGMGKLGGEELNAGSDVDLIYFYDSDEGAVWPRGSRTSPTVDAAPASMTLHEYWQRVARRLTATIEDVTEEGYVWRVDLRLRPEGGSGPLVNSLAAAERYYESFGRLWERAAMLRARPVAGSLALGDDLLGRLSPFVWRKRIDPSVATELVHLVRRARAELSNDPDRDLKLGAGGIREAEFFVQALQLVWGGKDASLRARPTLVALARLESKGLCTVGEAADISDGYLVLRRAEHAVQIGSGVQTHELPLGEDRVRIARILGFVTAEGLTSFLDEHRGRIARRFASLLPEGEDVVSKWSEVLGALELGETNALAERLRKITPASSDDLILAMAGNLLDLGKHPDSVLGVRTRETYPGLADTLLDALFEAADPFQAARYLRVFFERVRQVAVYVRLLFSDPAALRRMMNVVGASAFIGDALCNNPELGDMILFSRGAPSEDAARHEVLACLHAPVPPEEDPEEAFVGALRLAKTRLTLEVALGDVSGEWGVREVNRALTAIADASLEAATRRALGTDAPKGLSVVAMGKLGGREISYGSDLDVIFVFDPAAAPDPSDAAAFFTRAARKIIRYISTFHGAGPGYELDTRLRPSGNQGLLVTSLDAFARYHEGAATSRRAAVWEKMALVRARPAAGDAELGARVLDVARAAAFGDPPDPAAAAAEMARIRARVEREAGQEKNGVYDLKLGRGALLDIEFIVQFLQIGNGPRLPASATTAETPRAIEELAAAGVLDADRARVLADAYTFLRRLELRVRVQRGDASHVLDTRSPVMGPLARRMGMRDHPARSASEALTVRYQELTTAVRAVFDDVFATPDRPPERLPDKA